MGVFCLHIFTNLIFISMKKKFNILMTFFSLFKKCNKNDMVIEVTCDDDEFQYVSLFCKDEQVSLPSNMEAILEDFVKMFIPDITEIIYKDYDYDYISRWFTFDIKIIGNSMIIYKIHITMYDTEQTYDEYNVDEEKWKDKIIEFLDENDLEEITVTYNGGADDGYIDNNYSSIKGEGEISSELENVCYDLLETSFAGWEINEGSSGEITITKNKIKISHIWNTENPETIDLEKEINLKTLED
jgi:hypothetical protein